MASRRLDCVLGVVRLISSASTMLVKSGPGLKTNSLFSGSQMLTPITSEGSMSEVNWIRWKPAPMERASAAASVVFPTPGTSSMRRWPRARRPTTASRITWGLPTNARPTFCSSLRIRSRELDMDFHYTLAAPETGATADGINCAWSGPASEFAIHLPSPPVPSSSQWGVVIAVKQGRFVRPGPPRRHRGATTADTVPVIPAQFPRFSLTHGGLCGIFAALAGSAADRTAPSWSRFLSFAPTGSVKKESPDADPRPAPCPEPLPRHPPRVPEARGMYHCGSHPSPRGLVPASCLRADSLAVSGLD